jgi:lipid-A-disaccharide synthase
MEAAPAHLPILLFTAFEPSGDDHAAGVIAELKRRYSDLPIYGWGGPKMAEAGATIIERTGDDAVMGLPGVAKIRQHQLINARIDRWMADQKRLGLPVAVHIPTDSPAANFPICKIAKSHGAKVVHLVAPQIWAWGRWRIHKLRRLTDRVLCLLPFEESFFKRRNVPARYIGHMLFDHPLDFGELDRLGTGFDVGEPRLALFPGSRPDELRKHFPVLLDAFRDLKKRYPRTVGLVAAVNARVGAELREAADVHGGWPVGLGIATSETDAVVRWCQIAIVKSGTVTLQVAKQRRPMVIFYKKSNPFLFLLARLVLSTRTFSLPNLIARRRVVPELIPHFGGAGPIVKQVRKLIDRPGLAAQQRKALDEIVSQFEGVRTNAIAADEIALMAGLEVLHPIGPAVMNQAEPDLDANPVPRRGEENGLPRAAAT